MKLTEENIHRIQTMAENFKLLRKTRNWSLEGLSQRSGISVTILADIESGQEFDTPYLFELCAIYNIRPHEVFLPLNICR